MSDLVQRLRKHACNPWLSVEAASDLLREAADFIEQSGATHREQSGGKQTVDQLANLLESRGWSDNGMVHNKHIWDLAKCLHAAGYHLIKSGEAAAPVVDMVSVSKEWHAAALKVCDTESARATAAYYGGNQPQFDREVDQAVAAFERLHNTEQYALRNAAMKEKQT